MNISHLPVRCAAHAGFYLALVPLSVGMAFAASAAPAIATPAAPKTHVLFMGADISLERDKKFHRVEDVTATALVIKPDGKRIEVPQSRELNLFINEALKLARTSVEINGLKAEPAYTPAADPFNKLARSAALAAGESAVTDLAQGEVMRADAAALGANNELNMVRGTPSEGVGRAAVKEAEDRQLQAMATVTQAYNTPSSEIYNVGSRSVATGVEASREMFDAIRLSFEVTPERNLIEPYYAVIAQIRERDSKPGQVRKWAYVKSLGAMSAGVPTKVSVYQGGLPPGYVLESCEVHLYNHGSELATNLSRKRVPLTDEEAMDYRIIDYISVNKGRTLPATPATLSLTSEVRATLTPAQLSQTCYVRVAKSGRVTAVFRDPAGQGALADATLESALKTLRFKPALEAGKPIESIAPITIDQFASP